MGTELNETQILTAALITSGIGTTNGVPGQITSDTNNPADCLKLSAVREYTGGIDNIDACYVGETDGSIILAFRGTTTKFDDLADDLLSFLDWLNDFNAEPVSLAPTFPGKVHSGFAASVVGLSKLFLEDIQGRVAQSKKALVVTGYSKGAALAPLAAWLLKSSGIAVDALHIYEPPRCGDTDFANAFNAAFPNTVRYEYQDDLVPHTPPTKTEWQTLVQQLGTSNTFVAIMHLVFPDIDSWDYASVGTLQFVDWNNVIWSEPGLLEALGDIDRMVHLANDFAQSSTAPLADHDPNGHLFDVVKKNFSCPCDCPSS